MQHGRQRDAGGVVPYGGTEEERGDCHTSVRYFSQ